MWYCKTLLDYVEKKVPIESFTSTKFCDIEKMNIIENLQGYISTLVAIYENRRVMVTVQEKTLFQMDVSL